MIVVDANIMLRLQEPGHAHCVAALDAIAYLRTNVNESFARFRIVSMRFTMY